MLAPLAYQYLWANSRRITPFWSLHIAKFEAQASNRCLESIIRHQYFLFMTQTEPVGNVRTCQHFEYGSDVRRALFVQFCPRGKMINQKLARSDSICLMSSSLIILYGKTGCQLNPQTQQIMMFGRACSAV